MALYDDKWWLLSHISHSFVLSDDTGNAELVMNGRDAADLMNRAKRDAVQEGTEDFLEPLEMGGDRGGDEYRPHSFEIRAGRNQLG